MTYREQLDDVRWIKLSKKVKELYDNRCCGCGNSENLNAHHIRYYKNRKAWEYEVNDLTVLCQECHSKYHENIKKLNKLLENNILYYQYEFSQIIEMLELIIDTPSFKYLHIIAYLQTIDKTTF